jgi:hypothetical protein
MKKSKKTKRKRSYTMLFKKAVIRDAEITRNKSKTAKKYRILRHSVIEWIKKKDKIFATKQHFKRRKIFLSENGKKSMYEECEVLLFDWWKNQRDESKIVNITDIQNKMIELVRNRDKDSSFKASKGWANRFMNRFDLRNRRITGCGKNVSKECKTEIINYLKAVEKMRQNIPLKAIFNFDETSFYMDMPGNYTLAKKGEKRVFAKTTGKEMARLSCLFTSSADGTKLPILCVVPRKKEITV